MVWNQSALSRLCYIHGCFTQGSFLLANVIKAAAGTSPEYFRTLNCIRSPDQEIGGARFWTGHDT